MRKTTDLNSCFACPVRQLNVFKQLPNELVAAIENYRSEQILLSSKEFLYKQGDIHSNTYTLFSGWIMLYKTLDNGSRQILRYALPGDFLSFQAGGDSPINHTAQALTECSLCVFPRSSILGMFANHPELASQIAWITARDMNSSHEYLINIGRKNAKERMAYLLLDLYNRLHNQVLQPDSSMALPMTQEDIADTIGLTLVHVNRTLRALREDGLISLNQHKLTILNYTALAELAGFSSDGQPGSQPLL
jgi:CRP/FNR family transcriptional regulator, anaerobic regulatory protein